MDVPRAALHKRSNSHSSSSSGSSAHRLILEHILNYPGTYELPLRTMYALNSAPPASARPSVGDAQASRKPSQAAQQLTTSLMAELSQMPNQPTSLPPSFITSFVRKCFASELSLVDFPQALTGLDYLKDLDSRRCREAKAALERLEINLDNCDSAEDTLREKYPAALEWYRSLEDNTHKVEALYTQLYVALRRWILINELSLTPFNKYSCVAMLNTVYPPVISSQPTPQLTASILKAQRDGFFKYIQGVERSGSAILSNLIAQGRRQGEETGWPATRDLLDRYLHTANSMIDESARILHLSEAAQLAGSRSGRKADSGINFLHSSKSSTSSAEAPSAPVERPVSRQHKSSTTLEKIAREIRHMRRNKTDVSEMITQVEANVEEQDAAAAAASKPVRKMKSLSSINLRRTTSRAGSVASASGKSEDVSAPEFDPEKMKQLRERWERTKPQFIMMAAG